MFNQSFSVRNFRKIFNCENRKGINLERKYFPSVKQISEELKEIQSKLKALERQEPKGLSFEEQKTELNDWNLKISKSIHKNKDPAAFSYQNNYSIILKNL